MDGWMAVPFSESNWIPIRCILCKNDHRFSSYYGLHGGLQNLHPHSISVVMQIYGFLHLVSFTWHVKISTMHFNTIGIMCIWMEISLRIGVWIQSLVYYLDFDSNPDSSWLRILAIYRCSLNLTLPLLQNDNTKGCFLKLLWGWIEAGSVKCKKWRLAYNRCSANLNLVLFCS